MKKILFALLLTTTLASQAAMPPVTEKVLKAFASLYPSITEVSWYEYETYYEAHFKNDDVRCDIRYDFNGNVISTKRYYGERSLSPFIKAKLLQKYPAMKVFGVTEITNEQQLQLYIVLEDEKNWVYVASDSSGMMTTTQKLRKA
jgi:hypothetical protein